MNQLNLTQKNTFGKSLPFYVAFVYLFLMSIIVFGQDNNPISKSRPEVDSALQHVQISFLPFISTNGWSGRNSTNDVSINIIGGYSKEIRMADIGLGFNIVGENMRHCQVAGYVNVVGQKAQGLQLAGWANYAKQLEGAQIAGFVNFARETQGIQVAGFVNQTNKGNALQIAGFVNNTNDSAHVQIAGFVNNSQKQAQVQIAGFVNNTRCSPQIQVAGFVNNSRTDSRVQIAGFVNNATNNASVQIAGFVNNTKVLTGIQLGMFNTSDSCSGIPIGFFSFARNGYHKIELSADELFQANIAFRCGVKHFHNIMSASIQTQNLDKPIWAYGYGFGSSFGNPDKTMFDIDITAQHIIKQDTHYDLNDLFKLYIGVDRKLFSKISLAAGLSYNFYLTDTKFLAYGNTFDNLPRYHQTDHTYGNGTNMKTWVGAKLALRFL